MEEVEKLLRRLNRKDRERLLKAMETLRQGNLSGWSVKKIVGSSMYRVRVGNFRILFSVDKKKNFIVIEGVHRRNERTYR
ncbi:MAG TPA: type II toxin-antitoxin system RelE/ParE family toxin [Patescibacteria group bacterium]|nr:type II toxin-antitoxin system RelE/ParE family toxin [Patescibacteria group bacterium]